MKRRDFLVGTALSAISSPALASGYSDPGFGGRMGFEEEPVGHDTINLSDFSDIQTALDAIPSIGGILDIPSGVHEVSAKLTVKPYTTIRGRGEAVIKPASGFTDDRIFLPNTGVTIENIGYKGAVPLVMATSSDFPTNTVLERMTFDRLRSTGGPLINLQGDAASLEMRTVRILKPVAINVSTSTIYVARNVNGLLIEDPDISQPGATSGISAHITVTGLVSPDLTTYTSYGQTSLVEPCTDVVIRGARLSLDSTVPGGGSGIILGAIFGLQLVDTTIRGARDIGVDMLFCKDFNVGHLLTIECNIAGLQLRTYCEKGNVNHFQLNDGKGKYASLALDTSGGHLRKIDFDNFAIHGAEYSAIYSPSSAYLEDIHFSNGSISETGLAANVPAVSLEGVHKDITFDGVCVDGAKCHGIYVNGDTYAEGVAVNNCRIIGWDTANNGCNAIRVRECMAPEIIGNYARTISGMMGGKKACVALLSPGTMMHDNNLRDAARIGAVAEYKDAASVKNEIPHR